MSEIITDNLTGKTSAGNVTITSEGGSATQSLQQGVLKMWCLVGGGGTPTITDSLNVASLIDNDIGEIHHNFVNNMSNANFSLTMTGSEDSFNANVMELGIVRTSSKSDAYLSRADTGAFVDADGHNAQISGDLA
jgi:hypothetical protein